MTCKNCDPSERYLGKIIKVSKDLNHCSECGEELDVFRYLPKPDIKWDKYFHTICESVASKSPCLSRKIGAVLVRDYSIISTGYNGPPRKVPHCGHSRVMKDQVLNDLITIQSFNGDLPYPNRYKEECPRKVLGYESGTHLELCPAQHAEANTISNAARLGVSVLNSTLYMNCVIPCKNCLGMLINAGVVEVVVDETTVYDKHTQFLIDNSDIKIRKFEL